MDNEKDLFVHLDEDEFDLCGQECYEFNDSLDESLDDRCCEHCRKFLTTLCEHLEEFLDDLDE